MEGSTTLDTAILPEPDSGTPEEGTTTPDDCQTSIHTRSALKTAAEPDVSAHTLHPAPESAQRDAVHSEQDEPCLPKNEECSGDWNQSLDEQTESDTHMLRETENQAKEPADEGDSKNGRDVSNEDEVSKEAFQSSEKRPGSAHVADDICTQHPHVDQTKSRSVSPYRHPHVDQTKSCSVSPYRHPHVDQTKSCSVSPYRHPQVDQTKSCYVSPYRPAESTGSGDFNSSYGNAEQGEESAHSDTHGNGDGKIPEREENEEEQRCRIRLSHILESSGMVPDTPETGMTPAPDSASTVKDAVCHLPVADTSMIAGDGPEDHFKAKGYQPPLGTTLARSPGAEATQLALASDRNLEAGGDAGGVPRHDASKAEVFRPAVAEYMDKSQPFRESTPDRPQAHHVLQSTEKLSRGTSIQKGELVFKVDPPVIPVKSIHMLGGMGSQDSGLDNLNAVPFLPPDASLLYQPELGVMKSKPVPKPTRGRRGRRRSPTLTSGFPGYRPFVPHLDMRFPEQARLVPGHPYQRYMVPDFAPAVPGEYCQVVPGHGGDFVAYPAEAVREAMGGGENTLSPCYPGNRWCCKDDYFKVPRPIYAPAPRARGRGSSGGRGRPRGRRGSGGVRQYLQHRLLWARYTGRSQEALDRVLSIINSKCGLQEDVGKEVPSPRLWGVADTGQPSLDAAAAADLMDEGLYGRLDSRGSAERPVQYRGEGLRGDPDPFSSPYCPRATAFSSNINNMMTGGSGSILSQSGIASNAVVDGNGYIVYLNQEDSTEFQHPPPAPFVPPESSLTDRGDPALTMDRPLLHGTDVKTENDVRKTDEMTPSQPACVGVETNAIVPSKLVVEGIPPDSDLAVMGAPGETSTMAAMPLEDSLTAVPEGFSEKEGGKRMPGRKRGTPKTTGMKTPVSPVKEPKLSKRHSQTSGGRPKKKVRRTLTFSSPIKQEETLRATENIANALTNTGPETDTPPTCSASSTDDFLPSSTPLPSISNLLHSSTNAGISINIHVTNDANKERGATHTGTEDVGAGARVMPSALEQTTKNTVRADLLNRPAEVAPHVHYPAPRYTVEWHGDYHQDSGDPAMERPRRYQDHVLPGSGVTTTTASRFRYPYRDPNSSHSYYSQQHAFPAPATPLDRYYTSDYSKEWSGPYARYPPEHFLTGYEAPHPSPATSYPPVQWTAGWSRNPDLFMESYQKHPSSRAGLDVDVRDVPDVRDIPYGHFHRVAAGSYPQPQADFAEEVYPQHRPPPYGSYGGPAMVTHHIKERVVAAVPEGIQDVGQAEEDYESHRLHRPWALTSCPPATQVLPEGSVAQLAPSGDSPQQLQGAVGCSVVEPGHLDAGEDLSHVSEQSTQMEPAII